jgi:hypothetical protein
MLDRHVAVDVGRHVFPALNSVEAALALTVFLMTWHYGLADSAHLAIPGVLAAMVAAQVCMGQGLGNAACIGEGTGDRGFSPCGGVCEEWPALKRWAASRCRMGVAGHMLLLFVVYVVLGKRRHGG